MGIAIGIIGTCLFIAIPVIIIVAIVRGLSRKDSNGDANIHGFEKVIRSIYVYIILVISFCMMIFGVIGAFNTGLNVLLPEQDENNSSYGSYSYRTYSDENENKRNCISYAAVAVAGVPLFICHSKIANKMNKKSNKEIKNA